MGAGADMSSHSSVDNSNLH